MSEALYRKYRPQTFEDVVGQTHIERTLKNAIESDKVSHAYLFCGPRGTGKTTTARLLAKALLCESGPTPSPDGTCEQCKAIADGTHPDVNEMDAASRTGVENVREEIIGRVQYAPIRGHYKIYIIDEVHMLSTAAFNALLKTLEEPPDHVVFILCTTDPQKVPETIHSRCQRFDFHRLSNEEIVSRLGAVCMSEGVQFEGDALDLIAHRAQGGMRDALTTLEQLIAFGNGSVTTEVACNVLGSLDVDDMTTIVDAIATRDAAMCFTWLSEYIETGADLAQFTRDLAAYVRDLYVLELTDGAISVNAPASSQDAMAHEAKKFGPDRLVYILRVLGDLSTELRSSSNARLSFEIALTRMVRPESDLTLESLAARIEALEAAVAAAPVSDKESVAQANVARVGATPVSASKVAAVVASGAAELKEVSAASTSQEKKPQETQHVWPTPSASVPRASAGYKPLTQQETPSSPTIDAATAAMNKAASLRAQMEQRQAAPPSSATEQRSDASKPAVGNSAQQAATPSRPAVSSQPVAPPSESPMPLSPTVSNQDAPASASTSNVANDSVRAKLTNPAALQRGWKATLSELKRQRAVYAALMQSARIVAEPDGSGIVIEFSKENNFAFSAAQKSDVVAALSAALEGAFGGAVPLRFAQGGGIVAGIHAATPGASSTPSVEHEQTNPRVAAPSATADVKAQQEYGVDYKELEEPDVSTEERSDSAADEYHEALQQPAEPPFSSNPSPIVTNQERADVSEASSVEPKASPDNGMEIEDIFNTFGVSMEDVQEEY